MNIESLAGVSSAEAGKVELIHLVEGLCGESWRFDEMLTHKVRGSAGVDADGLAVDVVCAWPSAALQGLILDVVYNERSYVQKFGHGYPLDKVSRLSPPTTSQQARAPYDLHDLPPRSAISLTGFRSVF